ncbi:ck1 family protein kinase [Stylonychia lemnae]|uniref:Casein kinase I n=1 Tax=Stylonychia lemnae TaxID=5949 RepID=A0A078A0J7_STYLE|nr:ck1 family protein kinase [Stylonychia lemnae]|eukprot:CDW75670.1 ck1 family protein kinase [Stylonychia lemnae]
MGLFANTKKMEKLLLLRWKNKVDLIFLILEKQYFFVKYKKNNKKQMRKSQLSKNPRLPQMYGSGIFQIEIKSEKGEELQKVTVQYIILDYFEQTLNQYYKLKVDQFGIESQIQVLEEVVNLIKSLHAFNYIHNDIKPDNFMVKNSKSENENHIYLIDFGSIDQFKQEYFDDMKKVMLKGTPFTASIHTMKGLYSCQGDDLISALYSLLILSIGQKIPWHDLCLQFDLAKRKYQFYDLIHDEKVKLKPDLNIYGKFENALINQIKILEKLRFEEPLKYTIQIDYDSIIQEVKSDCRKVIIKK